MTDRRPFDAELSDGLSPSGQDEPPERELRDDELAAALAAVGGMSSGYDTESPDESPPRAEEPAPFEVGAQPIRSEPKPEVFRSYLTAPDPQRRDAATALPERELAFPEWSDASGEAIPPIDPAATFWPDEAANSPPLVEPAPTDWADRPSPALPPVDSGNGEWPDAAPDALPPIDSGDPDWSSPEVQALPPIDLADPAWSRPRIDALPPIDLGDPAWSRRRIDALPPIDLGDPTSAPSRAEALPPVDFAAPTSGFPPTTDGSPSPPTPPSAEPPLPDDERLAPGQALEEDPSDEDLAEVGFGGPLHSALGTLGRLRDGPASHRPPSSGAQPFRSPDRREVALGEHAGRRPSGLSAAGVRDLWHDRRRWMPGATVAAVVVIVFAVVLAAGRTDRTRSRVDTGPPRPVPSTTMTPESVPPAELLPSDESTDPTGGTEPAAGAAIAPRVAPKSSPSPKAGDPRSPAARSTPSTAPNPKRTEPPPGPGNPTATSPPATSPPATSPPATSPPATSPPATSPPPTAPPTTGSPVTRRDVCATLPPDLQETCRGR